MSEGDFLLPTGTVTLVLADVEGSTRAWEADPIRMREAMQRLSDVVSETIGRHGGVRPLEQGEGDSFVAAFPRAADAVAGALALQAALEDGDLRLRVGVHTGDVQRSAERSYVGQTVNRAARLRDVAHGGQIVLSHATHDLVVDRLPEGVTLRDLGTHRLRDLSRPEHIFQLCVEGLQADFPPLRSLDVIPHNLPTYRTSFVGRRAEMAEVGRLLAETSLLTLTGSGGCGKTRLAVQAAADALDGFPDGAWLVDLAPLTDPDTVPAQVAAALSVRESAGLGPTEAVVAYLKEKSALLVLDNCEHVVEAAADLADGLLTACPSLHILATSRQPLGIEGEVLFRVPSLSLPTTDEPAPIEAASDSEAVQLFVDRARKSKPAFELTDQNAAAVAEICRRLDGIPLAIELAGARVRVLSPSQIATGLEERFRLLTGGARTAMPRQQTLEASVDWSYALLTEPERAVFRRASVFAGSFDLEAAERVCSDGDVAPHQVLDLLSLLVDKSLILAEDGPGASRFRLLETIRHYALAHLSSCAELDQTRDRHLDVYTELAERAEPNLETRDLIGWLDRLDAEHDNLRAALDRAVQSGAAESGLRLVGASSVYWTTSGRYHETIDVISRLLDQAEEVDAHVRAKAWWAAARCHYALGDASDEARTAGEALRLAGETGDRRLEGRALMQSVWHQVWWSDVDAAKEAMRQAVRISEQVGDWTNVASSLTTLAARELVDGADTALATFSEAEAATRRADNPIDDAALDYWLAWLRIDQGRLEDAARLCDEGLALTRALRSRFDELGFLTTAAAVASYRGETAAARSLVEEGWRLGRSVAIPITFWWLGLADFQAGWAAGDLDFVPRLRDEVLPVVSKLETSGIRAYVLGMLSRAALAQGDLGEGRRLAEAAAAAHPPRGFTERPDLPLARVLRAEGDHHGAEDLYHEAVAHAHKRHARPDAVGLLEELAGAIASQESYAEAARLFGAAQAARDEMGYVRFVTDRPRCEADLQLAREALGDDAFDAAFAEGMTMSLDEAVAYAQRGRGERKRPSSGWASLTPTELEVVKLVRQGKSNPQIADRLHISARTVQSHLTHIFAKLGPSNRTELATEAMRRGI